MTDQYLLDLFRYGRCCDTCKHAVSCQWEADEERYYTHTHTHTHTHNNVQMYKRISYSF